LKTAFTASKDVPFNAQVLPASSVTAEQLERQDVLIINDVQRLPDTVRGRLGELRKAGQGQLVVLGQYADLNWWGGIEGFPVRPTEKVDVTRDRSKPSQSPWRSLRMARRPWPSHLRKTGG
jgi:hypothetical protein